jgi:lipopolysaccharide/colanic/teichoic acid biosynthesis glycosyltransferase
MGGEVMRRKRVFDLVMISGGLIVFAPVMATLAVGIRLEDGGPVFFRQDRMGRGKAPFSILKFRSMRPGEEVTGMGRWIRATGLDEVAQFLNILRGEMSLVGPRPLTAADVQRLGWDGPETTWRFDTAPGVTGMAQVFGRGARPSLALDQQYVAAKSLRLDAELVAISFAMNALGKSRVRGLLKRPGAARLEAVRLARAAT